MEAKRGGLELLRPAVSIFIEEVLWAGTVAAAVFVEGLSAGPSRLSSIFVLLLLALLVLLLLFVFAGTVVAVAVNSVSKLLPAENRNPYK